MQALLQLKEKVDKMMADESLGKKEVVGLKQLKLLVDDHVRQMQQSKQQGLIAQLMQQSQGRGQRPGMQGQGQPRPGMRPGMPPGGGMPGRPPMPQGRGGGMPQRRPTGGRAPAIAPLSRYGQLPQQQGGLIGSMLRGRA